MARNINLKFCMYISLHVYKWERYYLMKEPCGRGKKKKLIVKIDCRYFNDTGPMTIFQN